MLDPHVILAPLLLLPIAGMLRFIGCGAEFTPAVPGVIIDPESVSLSPGEQKDFDARFDDGTSILQENVHWSVVEELPNSGVIDSDGKYTAPDPFQPGLTSVAITAEYSIYLPAYATVTLTPLSMLKVTPPSVKLLPGTPQPFEAHPKQDVTWSIDPPGTGDIESTGSNTADYTFPGPFQIGLEPFKVRATSTTDASLTGTATVTLIGNGAQFVPPPDTATLGTWKDTYGAAGWAVAGAPPDKLPPFLPVLDTASLVVFTFVDPTTDEKGLQKPPDLDTRFVAVWFDADVLTLEFDFSDLDPHRVAFYCIDWTQQGRAQTFEFFDASQVPPQLLDTKTLSNFEGGQYLIWDLAGKVLLKVTRTAGPNAVISGIFFQ